MTARPNNTTNVVELDDEAAAITQRLHRIQVETAKLDDEAAELKARLRKLLQVGQRGLVDGVPVVTLQPNRRFDMRKALELIPAELHPQCLADGYDPKKVKRYLAPALLEACMVEAGEPKVILQ